MALQVMILWEAQRDQQSYRFGMTSGHTMKQRHFGNTAESTKLIGFSLACASFSLGLKSLGGLGKPLEVVRGY